MSLKTKYASAERSNIDELKRQSKFFEKNDLLNDFLTKIPAIFLIINRNRQIVYINNGALEFTGLNEVAPAIGKRPGELIGCIHSNEEEGGCGTSEACTYCGAVNAVLKSQRTGQKAVMDCRLILGPDHTAYDLRVWASPLAIMDEEFTVVTIQDIGNEKWRGFLERIFFHDILNIITPLMGNIELLKDDKLEPNTQDLINNIETITKHLVEEVLSQQLIMNAENDSLQTSHEKTSSQEILNDIRNLYKNYSRKNGKSLKIAPNSDFIDIFTDKTIIKRILGNMVKNALEASSNEDTVTIGCSIKEEHIKFWVHNPVFIPKQVQLQIFSRSFSTKGNGRGLGTYSMKVLGSFLKGDVSFSTSKESGTIFIFSLPLKEMNKL